MRRKKKKRKSPSVCSPVSVSYAALVLEHPLPSAHPPHPPPCRQSVLSRSSGTCPCSLRGLRCPATCSARGNVCRGCCRGRAGTGDFQVSTPRAVSRDKQHPSGAQIMAQTASPSALLRMGSEQSPLQFCLLGSFLRCYF